MKENVFEINVNVMLPHDEEMAQDIPCDEENETAGMSLEQALEVVFDEIRPMVYAAVSGFVQLSEEVLTLEQRNEMLHSLERLERTDDAIGSLEMLYAIFLGSKLKVSAEAVHDVIELSEYFPELSVMFMEEFFESDDIDEYLVTSWLTDEFGMDSAGEVAS